MNKKNTKYYFLIPHSLNPFKRHIESVKKGTEIHVKGIKEKVIVEDTYSAMSFFGDDLQYHAWTRGFVVDGKMYGSQPLGNPKLVENVEVLSELPAAWIADERNKLLYDKLKSLNLA